ncbi:unnamed protein product [Boreogadus saida]
MKGVNKTKRHAEPRLNIAETITSDGQVRTERDENMAWERALRPTPLSTVNSDDTGPGEGTEEEGQKSRRREDSREDNVSLQEAHTLPRK